jgi:thiol-disulfide isomerase/thioredoxin
MKNIIKYNIKYAGLSIILVAILTLTACSQNNSENAESVAEPIKTTEQTISKNTVNKMAGNVMAADGIDAPLDFSLTNLEGDEVNAEDYRGQWLVINYWATWCAPCRDEMPELVKFQAENEGTVQVVGIAYEDAEIEKLKNFAEDFNINYPLLTIDVYNPPAFAAEGGLGLPTTIVYNPEGMRHKKHMGPIDAEGLEEMLQ